MLIRTLEIELALHRAIVRACGSRQLHSDTPALARMEVGLPDETHHALDDVAILMRHFDLHPNLQRGTGGRDSIRLCFFDF